MSQHTSHLKSHWSITQPACLSCSSCEQDNNISVFKHTQSLYRQGNHHAGKTRLYTERGEMENSQIKRKKNKKTNHSYIIHRLWRLLRWRRELWMLVGKTRPDWAKLVFETGGWPILADKVKCVKSCQSSDLNVAFVQTEGTSHFN